MARVVLAVAVAALAGCVTTTFTGAAKVPGGPDGCRARCEGWGMQLAGMVQLGEYSDGCICEVKRVGAGTSSASAAIPAAAGVHMQMVAEAQRQQNSPDLFNVSPPPNIEIPPPPPPSP